MYIGKRKELSPDLIGQTFGQLTVVGFVVRERGRQKCVCQCSCGNVTEICPSALLDGHRKSCGCLRASTYHKYKYLIGQKINSWTVLDIKGINKVCYASCMCECGTIKDINVYNLMNGYSRDCGCGRKQMLSDTKSSDLVGQRFGKLTAIEKMPESNKFKRTMYRCKCDCGNEIITSSGGLLSGNTKSCGCMVSQWNAYIDILLNEMQIEHKAEYSVDIEGHHLRFDFYLPTYNTMIEYDGEQHYKPINFGGWDNEELQAHFNKTQLYDQLKNNYCKENNIDLLRIPYWEKQNIKEIIYNHLQRLNRRDFVA